MNFGSFITFIILSFFIFFFNCNRNSTFTDMVYKGFGCWEL